jgi:DNA excision repair protein ERCC-3
VSEGCAAIVQGDRSVLVEVDHPGYESARQVLVRCAELEKSPEHVHTYRLSDLSLYNAASAGESAERVVDGLRRISRFPVPSSVEHEIRDRMARHGVCCLHDKSGDPTVLRLKVSDPFVRQRLGADGRCREFLRPCPDGFLVPINHRGTVKQALLRIGYPVVDRAGLVDGRPLRFELRSDRITPYGYQKTAVDAFVDAESHGVLVLPCGAGKTVIGMMAAARLATWTLVIVTGREASTQWRREVLDKTTLGLDDVTVYDSASHKVAPLTVTTYAMLSRRGGAGKTGHAHFDTLAEHPWGLIIYDEVHLLPAPIFRLTAELQARRRLGLTATLVREDGRAGEVFALIGPKRYDAPWRELEASGHIAAATCYETRVGLLESLRTAYATADARQRPRIAAENPAKLAALAQIAERHVGDRTLILGTYLDSLQSAARLLEARIVTGETPHAERERAYEDFRSGRIRRLVLSRVGNFSVDLPDANVLIQLSGTMGSRQEEAQRLGRVLRPKPGGATFYTLVTRDTVEQDQALHRQLFLTEQGYRYYIEDFEDPRVPGGADDHVSPIHD